MVSVVVKFWVSGALLWFWCWSPHFGCSFLWTADKGWVTATFTATDRLTEVCLWWLSYTGSLCLQPLSLVRTCCWLVMESEACFNAREWWPPDVINENKYVQYTVCIYKHDSSMWCATKMCVSAPFKYYSQTLAGESNYWQLLRWVSGRGKPMTLDNKICC